MFQTKEPEKLDAPAPDPPSTYGLLLKVLSLFGCPLRTKKRTWEEVFFFQGRAVSNRIFQKGVSLRGLPLSTYAPRGRGSSSLLYISIAYYMQKGGDEVQIACKIAYVLNGRPLS